MVSKENFFKALYWDNEKRIINKKSLERDKSQWDKNMTFLDREKKLVEKLKLPEEKKIYFIVGLPRSGTTMLSQLLLNLFDLGAFYNRVAKYYSIPLYGYEQLLNQFKRSQEENKIDSNLGHTRGAFSPHEFGYFWQYWLGHDENDELENSNLQKVDWEGLRSTIYGISNMINKDLIVKSLVYNDFIIKELASIFPTARFIYIKRDFSFVCQSIIESRIKQYGDEKYWWSIRPKFFKRWQELSVEEQVANQVIYVSKKIETSLNDVDRKRVLNLSYENLIEGKSINAIKSFLQLDIIKAVDEIDFKDGNKRRFSFERMQEIKKALQKAKKNHGY